MEIKEYELKLVNAHDREIVLTYRGNENIVIRMLYPNNEPRDEILVPRHALEKFIEMIE